MNVAIRCAAAALLSAAAVPFVATLLPTEARADGCDAGAISSDLGQPMTVLRCYDNWAYVTNGELGDSTLLAQLQAGGWRNYSGFPSSLCRDRAAADGVPAAELSSFSPC